MSQLLFNTTHPEELRVAVVENNRLVDLIVESQAKQREQGNIYKCKITRIEPSIAAVFVNFGGNRHGFLPFKEISPSYFKKASGDTSLEKHNVKDLIEEGQELLVQVDKEERGSKGAALTTYISLAGSYLVLMPNNPRAGGISRRIEGEQRTELRDILNQLNIPEDMGVIVRTAGIGKSLEELSWDLEVLIAHWKAIQKAAEENPAPFLIYKESDFITRTVRDYFRENVTKIILDSEEAYEKTREYVNRVKPNRINDVELYSSSTPLFSHYQIEKQVDIVYQREVRLPSGGSIVIDRTEALVSIDINSARSTKGEHIEETALNTNLEAATEIARQLRLRDLGGLIVIDFIDMTPIRNQREVENALREAVKKDRARIQIGRISRFGLLEMSRQRLRPAVGEFTQVTCPRCHGQGTLLSTSSIALSQLRLIRTEASKEGITRVEAQLPLEVATYLLNEKRQSINEVENQYNTEIIIIPNQYIEIPDYRITPFTGEASAASYQRTHKPEDQAYQHTKTELSQHEPAVKQFTITPQAPTPTQEKGILKRLFSNIFGNQEKAKPTAATEQKPAAEPQKATEEKKPAGQRRPYKQQGKQRQSSGQQKSQHGGRRRPTGQKQGSSKPPKAQDQSRSQTRKSTTTETKEKKKESVQSTTKQTTQPQKKEIAKTEKPQEPSAKVAVDSTQEQTKKAQPRRRQSRGPGYRRRYNNKDRNQKTEEKKENQEAKKPEVNTAGGESDNKGSSEEKK